jgi:hypothetical protein
LRRAQLNGEVIPDDDKGKKSAKRARQVSIYNINDDLFVIFAFYIMLYSLLDRWACLEANR